MRKLWFNGNGNYYVLFILGGVIGLSFILTNGLLPNIKPNDTLEERVSELRTPASTDNESLQMSNIGFDPQSITVVPPSPTEGQIEENSIINPTTQPQITVIAANPNSTTTTPPINSSPTVSIGTTSSPSSQVIPTISSGLPRQVMPSTQAEIKRVLCNQYRICPVDSKTNPPNPPWTLKHLTALWNVVQRIYQSPTYKRITVDEDSGGIEIQRVDIISGITAGRHIGQRTSSYFQRTIPNSNLLLISDQIYNYNTTVLLEALFAHEIGHIAHWSPDRKRSVELHNACNDFVSTYGRSYAEEHPGKGDNIENYADAVSFYMTDAEYAKLRYLGKSKNLKIDHPCVYNFLKKNVFGGIEY